MTITATSIILAFVGIALGALFTGLIFHSKNSTVKANLDHANRLLEETKMQAQADLEQAKEDFENRINELKEALKENYDQMIEAKNQAHEAALKELKENIQSSMQVQKEQVSQAIADLKEQNKAATEDLLKERQKEFAESSSTNIGQIVNPLKEVITKMEPAMKESTEKSISINSSLEENLKHMLEQSKATQTTAEELTRAFKHQSKVQGDWGETVLNQLLESQGLVEGVHYETQATIRDNSGATVKTEEGAILRPDVILHLDQKREVIIDSKVSLTAFFDYVNAENDTDRQQALKAHIESLQKHVKELAKKDYSSYIQAPKVKMDYVIMFVPHTGALWTALNAQPDLWRKAMEQNVYIADEQTLYAALKIIQMTWTQIKQAQNHEEVYKLANEMIERVGQFAGYYTNVGKALEKAIKAYDDGQKKFEEKGQSIVQSANKLLKLGAKQSTKNPIPELLDVDDIQALNETDLFDSKEDTDILED